MQSSQVLKLIEIMHDITCYVTVEKVVFGVNEVGDVILKYLYEYARISSWSTNAVLCLKWHQISHTFV